MYMRTRSLSQSVTIYSCMYVCMHAFMCVCVCVCVYLYIPNRDAAALAEKVAKKAAASGGE